MRENKIEKIMSEINVYECGAKIKRKLKAVRQETISRETQDLSVLTHLYGCTESLNINPAKIKKLKNKRQKINIHEYRIKIMSYK